MPGDSQMSPHISLPAHIKEANLARKVAFAKDAFAMMDTDSGGTLTADEIATTCSAIGMALSGTEVEDVIHEYDCDASGQLDADEFVKLVMAKSKSPEEEMQEAWTYFDVDCNGCIDIDELKGGLERVGILLAPWELREMMQVADLNNDCVISAEEFALAYGSLPWIRAQGVSGLMQRIMDIWKILDRNSDGSVSIDELVEALTPMGSSKTEIDQMVKAADANGDGVVSFKEFLSAYHRNEWFKVRLLSLARYELQHAKEEQDALYKEKQREEREESAITFASLSAKDSLMKRRALRRHKSVRVAINKFWQAIEHFTTHGYAWISKDLYFTYHLKLRKAIYGPESVANQQQNIEIAEEDWKADSNRYLACDTCETRTRKMEIREMHGLPPSDPRPEGVDVIGYGCFFDSLFEMADGIVGREAGAIEGDLYASYIMKMLHTIVEVGTDSDGDATYRWADEECVYIGQGESWTDIEEPNYETCPGPGQCMDLTCDVAKTKLLQQKHNCCGPTTILHDEPVDLVEVTDSVNVDPSPQVEPDDGQQISLACSPQMVSTGLRVAEMDNKHEEEEPPPAPRPAPPVAQPTLPRGERVSRLDIGFDFGVRASTLTSHCSNMEAVDNENAFLACLLPPDDVEPDVVAKLEVAAAMKSGNEDTGRGNEDRGHTGQTETRALQGKVITILQTEATEGKEFEKASEEAYEAASEKSYDKDEVAAQKIQALYRGHMGRMQVQKILDLRGGPIDAQSTSRKEGAVLDVAPGMWHLDLCTEMKCPVEVLEDAALAALEHRHNAARAQHNSHAVQLRKSIVFKAHTNALSLSHRLARQNLDRSSTILSKLAVRMSATSNTKEDIAVTSFAVIAVCRVLNARNMVYEAQSLQRLWTQATAQEVNTSPNTTTVNLRLDEPPQINNCRTLPDVLVARAVADKWCARNVTPTTCTFKGGTFSAHPTYSNVIAQVLRTSESIKLAQVREALKSGKHKLKVNTSHASRPFEKSCRLPNRPLLEPVSSPSSSSLSPSPSSPDIAPSKWRTTASISLAMSYQLDEVAVPSPQQQKRTRRQTYHSGDGKLAPVLAKSAPDPRPQTSVGSRMLAPMIPEKSTQRYMSQTSTSRISNPTTRAGALRRKLALRTMDTLKPGSSEQRGASRARRMS